MYTMTPYNPYTEWQLAIYNNGYKRWSSSNQDIISNRWDEHNAAECYDDLLAGIPLTTKILDVGCGTGRNSFKYTDRHIDGVDMSPIAIGKAESMAHAAGRPLTFYTSNGVDLAVVKNKSYSAIMSTQCLESIIVYDIRYNLMKECYRILKPGGDFVFQISMGDPDNEHAVEYYYNNCASKLVNGVGIVRIPNKSYISNDLEQIGFKDIVITVIDSPIDGDESMWAMVKCKR